VPPDAPSPAMPPVAPPVDPALPPLPAPPAAPPLPAPLIDAPALPPGAAPAVIPAAPPFGPLPADGAPADALVPPFPGPVPAAPAPALPPLGAPPWLVAPPLPALDAGAGWSSPHPQMKRTTDAGTHQANERSVMSLVHHEGAPAATDFARAPRKSARCRAFTPPCTAQVASSFLSLTSTESAPELTKERRRVGCGATRNQRRPGSMTCIVPARRPSR